MNNRQIVVMMSLFGLSALLSCGTSDIRISDFAFNTTVAFAGDDRSVFVNTHVVLDGSNSKQGQEDNLIYRWEQIRGPTVDVDQESGPRVTVMLPEIGEYLFELRISSQNKILSSDDIQLIAIAPNEGGKIELEGVPIGFEKGHNPLREFLVAYAQLADTTNDVDKDGKTLLNVRNLLKDGEDQLSLTDIYLSPIDAEFWGKSLLEKSLLEFGEEVSWLVTPGLYELRAIDTRGVEFISRLDVDEKFRNWDLAIDSVVNDPINIQYAKKLMGEMKMCFQLEGKEQVYHYVMFAQVEHQLDHEYLVRGKSLSDQAKVSANFDSSLDRYQLQHNNSNGNIQYRYVFRIIGDRVQGVVEVKRRLSGKSEYELVDALPLLKSSSVALKKVH